MKKRSEPMAPVLPSINRLELPLNWKSVSIGSVCTAVEKINPKDNPEKKFKYIDISSIDNQKYQIVNAKHYAGSDAPSRARQLVETGDIIFSTVRTYLKNFSLVTEPFNGQIASTGFCVLRPAIPALSKYIYYFVQYQPFLTELSKFQRGTSYPAVRDNDVFAQLIPIAPDEEIPHIVAEIEKQFSRLDQAVQNLKRVKANLKRYKAAVLKAAVEGKLTEQWRKEHPDVEPADKLLKRILAERRKRWEENELAKMKAKGKVPKDDKWKSRCKDSEPIETSAFPKLPNKWIWARIEDVGQVQLGRQRAPKYHSGANMKPYLRVQNVFEDRIDLEDVMEMDFPANDFENYKLEPGDILLNEGQSPELLGRPAIYRGELPNACFTNTLIRFQVSPPIKPDFSLLVFRAYMRSRRFMKEGTITTNIAHLSAGRFAKIEYPLPPLEEQAEIVKESQKYLSIIDALNKEADRGLKRADRLRQAILKKAFSGQLIPSDREYESDS
ncbi:MAG: restriction endonuclease subunit S [Desulfobacterales bacterium]|nr:restriction endonuclease subunit S [Desulfobacterales bacterium]